jgi:murein DD-endopeptidase MepM/ murein hydrolase activator NlpD
MILKQKMSYLITVFCLFFFNACISRSDQKLVLKGSHAEEAVSLDPYFLARQAQAEHSFFGFAPSSSNGQNLTDYDSVDDDDESTSVESEHSTSMNTNKENNSDIFYNNLEIIWPTKGTLTSLFGMRTLRHRTRMHAGIDIGAMKGTPIIAAGDGQVLFAGTKRGYGYAVIIAHDNTHETLYAHMSRITVRVGQYVRRNKVIGYVGRTGHVTGSNLHFETRINGVAYNPLSFLPPNHLGQIKRGMKTPSLAEQLNYYNQDNRIAYNSNYKK